MFTTKLTSRETSPSVSFKTRYNIGNDETVITGFGNIDWQPVWEADDRIGLEPWEALDDALTEKGIADEYGYDDDGNCDKLDALRAAFQDPAAKWSWDASWKAHMDDLDAAAAKFAERHAGTTTAEIPRLVHELDGYFSDAVERMREALDVAALEFLESLSD